MSAGVARPGGIPADVGHRLKPRLRLIERPVFVAGTNEAKFAITPEGALTFRTAPDHGGPPTPAGTTATRWSCEPRTAP